MSSSLSFVIPCLNEADSLPAVLDRIIEVRDGAFADREVEILVADNGSADIGFRQGSGSSSKIVYPLDNQEVIVP